MLYTNDDNMTYDLENHRYTLTENGFKKYSGYSLSGKLDTEDVDQTLTIKFFLNRVSENVYGIILSLANNLRSSQCLLAQPNNRQRIYQALCREASDMLVNNRDISEEVRNGSPVCSVGLQILIENLYGQDITWQQYSYGVDY